MHKPPQLGKPFVHFAIIQNEESGKHRIIFRLSHGEYDAISMSYFIDTLESIFEGLPNTEYGHLSQSIRALSLQPESGSREFWKDLLKGASMTEIVPRIDVDSQVPSELQFYAPRTIEVNTALPDSITAACVVKAAWAFVFSQYTTTSYVLFGEIVSGRNLPGPRMERVAGCCVNMVPGENHNARQLDHP